MNNAGNWLQELILGEAATNKYSALPFLISKQWGNLKRLLNGVSAFSIFSRCLLMCLLCMVVLGALHIFCWLILATLNAYSTHLIAALALRWGLVSLLLGITRLFVT